MVLLSDCCNTVPKSDWSYRTTLLILIVWFQYRTRRTSIYLSPIADMGLYRMAEVPLHVCTIGVLWYCRGVPVFPLSCGGVTDTIPPGWGILALSQKHPERKGRASTIPTRAASDQEQPETPHRVPLPSTGYVSRPFFTTALLYRKKKKRIA